jgi:uncharacterized DUF497 family protein
VKISFDPAKRARNLRKHGLDLADAGAMLEKPCIELIDDRDEYGEVRWVSIGLLQGLLVACVWTEREGEEIRIISLRRATANEQEDYFRNIGG